MPDGRGHDRITQNRQYKNIYGLGKLPALKVAPLSPPHQQSQRELAGGYLGFMYMYIVYSIYTMLDPNPRETVTGFDSLTE